MVKARQARFAEAQLMIMRTGSSKHEFTRPEKEQDRINHIKTTGAQTGNAFLAYRNVDEVDAIINNWKKKSPCL